MPAKKRVTKLSKHIAAQTLTLIVSSLSLVAALAWNEAIKQYVAEFIQPYFAKGSGVISLFIYAIAITLITVLITYHLNKVTERVSKED